MWAVTSWPTVSGSPRPGALCCSGGRIGGNAVSIGTRGEPTVIVSAASASGVLDEEDAPRLERCSDHEVRLQCEVGLRGGVLTGLVPWSEHVHFGSKPVRRSEALVAQR